MGIRTKEPCSRGPRVGVTGTADGCLGTRRREADVYGVGTWILRLRWLLTHTPTPSCARCADADAVVDADVIADAGVWGVETGVWGVCPRYPECGVHGVWV